MHVSISSNDEDHHPRALMLVEESVLFYWYSIQEPLRRCGYASRSSVSPGSVARGSTVRLTVYKTEMMES